MVARSKWRFTHNLGLKIWSVLIAIILWYAVQEEERIGAFVDVDVIIKNRPTELVITNTMVNKINLTIEGSSARLNQLRDKPLAPFAIDLSNAVAGSTLYKIYSQDFKLPDGVKIKRINPQLITVVLEEQLKKTMPVHINFTGALEEGFELKSSTINPPQVEVIGPESEVEPLQELYTAEVDLTGLRQDRNLTLPLLLKNAIAPILAEQSQVQVALHLEEKTIERTINNVAVSLEGKEGYVIDPAVVEVTVRGPAGLVHDYSKQPPHTQVYLSTANQVLLQKRASVAVRVQGVVLPACQVVRIQPAQVRISRLP